MIRCEECDIIVALDGDEAKFMSHHIWYHPTPQDSEDCVIANAEEAEYIKNLFFEGRVEEAYQVSEGLFNRVTRTNKYLRDLKNGSSA